MSPTWTSYPQKASRCTQLQCLSLVVAEGLAESLLVWIKKTALWMLLSGWKVWRLFWLQLFSCSWFICNFLYCCNGSLFVCFVLFFFRLQCIANGQFTVILLFERRFCKWSSIAGFDQSEGPVMMTMLWVIIKNRSICYEYNYNSHNKIL